MNNEARELFGLERTFDLSKDKKDYIKSNPYFARHKYERLSLNDLIKDNPATNRLDLWKDQSYQEEKDNNPRDVIYGTRRLGKIRLANGRHRIKALRDAGYTHINVPILTE